MKVGEQFKMEYKIVNGELYHHGVKGMKWGVRRKKHKNYYPQLSKEDAKILVKAKRKKAIRRGAVAAGAILAAYGGYKVNKLLNSADYTINGKAVSRKEFFGTARMLIKNLH